MIPIERIHFQVARSFPSRSIQGNHGPTMLLTAFLVTRLLVIYRRWSVLPVGWLCLLWSESLTWAQPDLTRLPAGVPLYRDDVPPGVIASMQLQRFPHLCGYMQPVELQGPAGVQFALAHQGWFADNTPQPLRAALRVGAVYRFRMVGLPNHPEAELFPTLEVIDRTYPPAEREHRFPIPVEIAETDIEAALRGELVMRVIYLEDGGASAEPVSYAGGPQRVYDVSLPEDALQTADAFGRPLAILRIGSRVPDQVEGSQAAEFLYGSPPWLPIKDIPRGKTLSDIARPY